MICCLAIIVLGFEISDDFITGLKKSFKAKYMAAMKAAMGLYHKLIFPKHFYNSNRTRYRMEKRTDFYLKVVKPRRGTGTGRFVDNVLKGVSRRRMMNFFTIRAADGNNAVILRMKAPRYFTNPYVGTYTDDKGEKHTIKQQPDKAAEVTQINDQDKAAFRDFIRNELQQALKQRQAKSKRTIK